MIRNDAAYYDRAGNPIYDMTEWSAVLESTDPQVGDTTVQAGDARLRVSTTWLGVNLALGMDGPPVIFETLIYDDHGNETGRRWLYTTEAQAIEGHEEAVYLARGTLSAQTGARQVIEIRSEQG